MARWDEEPEEVQKCTIDLQRTHLAKLLLPKNATEEQVPSTRKSKLTLEEKLARIEAKKKAALGLTEALPGGI